MNRKSRVAFGPGAASLILIMVVLSMSVLGMLALMNARNESNLSRRAVDVIESVYALENQAQRDLGKLDHVVRTYGSQGNSSVGLELLLRNLPQGMSYDDGIVSWEETDGVRTLEVEAKIDENGQTHLISHILTAVAGNE